MRQLQERVPKNQGVRSYRPYIWRYRKLMESEESGQIIPVVGPVRTGNQTCLALRLVNCKVLILIWMAHPPVTTMASTSLRFPQMHRTLQRWISLLILRRLSKLLHELALFEVLQNQNMEGSTACCSHTTRTPYGLSILQMQGYSEYTETLFNKRKCSLN